MTEKIDLRKTGSKGRQEQGKVKEKGIYDEEKREIKK